MAAQWRGKAGAHILFDMHLSSKLSPTPSISEQEAVCSSAFSKFGNFGVYKSCWDSFGALTNDSPICPKVLSHESLRTTGFLQWRPLALLSTKLEGLKDRPLSGDDFFLQGMCCLGQHVCEVRLLTAAGRNKGPRSGLMSNY